MVKFEIGRREENGATNGTPCVRNATVERVGEEQTLWVPCQTRFRFRGLPTLPRTVYCVGGIEISGDPREAANEEEEEGEKERVEGRLGDTSEEEEGGGEEGEEVDLSTTSASRNCRNNNFRSKIPIATNRHFTSCGTSCKAKKEEEGEKAKKGSEEYMGLSVEGEEEEEETLSA